MEKSERGENTEERERERGGGGLTVYHIGHFGDIPCREVSVELIRRLQTLRMERGEV